MKLNGYSFLRCILPLAALILLNACKDDPDEGSFVPKEPQLSFGSGSLIADKNGGTYDILLSSNLPWRVKSDADWISVEDPAFSESGGEFTIRVTVSKNRVEEPRTGIIKAWITYDHEKTFVISQDAADPPPPRNVYVKPGGTGSGDSWSDATSLDNALSLELFPKDTIRLAAGIYSPAIHVTGGSASAAADYTFEIKNNISLVGGYPSDPTEESVSDPLSHATVLDGGNTANHVVTITAPKVSGQKIFMKGISIKNGNTASAANILTINGLAYNRHYGGGLIVGRAVVEMRQCTFTNNMSVGGGGAFHAFSDASVTLDNCLVSNNACSSSSGNGGAIYVDLQSEMIMNNSMVVDNAAGSFGGGMYIYRSSMYIYNSTIARNSAGGAGSTIASKAYGGIYIREGSGLMVNCTLHGNTASNIGGGIGLYGTAATPATLYVVSSTITANKVIHGSALGGGFYANSADCTVNFVNSIVSGNTRGATGTEFASDIAGASGYGSSRMNMIEADQVYDNNGTVIGGATFSYATMLGALADNGGPALTVKLAGDNNPAMTYGMAGSALISLGASLPKQPDAAIMGKDQTGADRSDKTYMGACVK